MQAPRDDLLPAKDDPFTQEELKAYDGSDTNKPVYVAIKGTSRSSSLSFCSPPFFFLRFSYLSLYLTHAHLTHTHARTHVHAHVQGRCLT
jgi:hypothetical protein